MKPALLDWPDHIVARAVNLAFNVGYATAVPGAPLVSQFRSIFGDPASHHKPPNGFETEFEELQGEGGLDTLASALIPGARCVLERRPSGPLPPCGTQYAGQPREKWLFINGICTDERLVQLNAGTLAAIFRRPIEPLYNATDSFALDLLACTAGKGFNTVTEAVAMNLLPLVEALCSAELDRVILLCHSQGTIIASIMIKWLDEILPLGPVVAAGAGAQKRSPERRAARRLADPRPYRDPIRTAAKTAQEYAKQHGLTRDHIGKLETYCFANCSSSMGPIAVVGSPVRHSPWIESYGNENDLVARLGVLAPPYGIGSARIEGDRYRHDGAWGHLLNAHYLNPILPAVQAGDPATANVSPFPDNLLQVPRLWGYYAGAQPATSYP
jgi:hypothetical protein